MKYHSTILLSIVLGSVLLIASFVGMKKINPVPENYYERFQAAEETKAPQPTAAVVETESEEEVFSGFYDVEGMTLKDRFQTPPGFSRDDYPVGSFEDFIEQYPLYKDGKEVKLYNKQAKENQQAHAAVLKMKLVEGDLQQCADSVIRLYAEYFYKNQLYSLMNFHLVNGFSCEYAQWMAGMRISVQGNETSWVQSASSSNDEKTFEEYLRFLFAYASTYSLSAESNKIKKADIQIGDIFIQSGSPGHVVMVLDVCTDDTGRKAFLLGQGYMPAQQFHVLKNPLHEEDPWYYLDELTYPFETPEYTFKKGSLRRLEYRNQLLSKE